MELDKQKTANNKPQTAMIEKETNQTNQPNESKKTKDKSKTWERLLFQKV